MLEIEQVRSVELDFPRTRQTYTCDCGPDILVPTLVYYGVEWREDQVMKLAHLRKSGTNKADILHCINYFGFDHRDGQLTLEDICDGIDHEWPTIITLQAYGANPVDYSTDYDDGHWVAAIGYYMNDSRVTRIIFQDPSSFVRTWLSPTELQERWHDIDAGKKKIHNWGCTVIGTPVYRSTEIRHMD